MGTNVPRYDQPNSNFPSPSSPSSSSPSTLSESELPSPSGLPSTSVAQRRVDSVSKRVARRLADLFHDSSHDARDSQKKSGRQSASAANASTDADIQGKLIAILTTVPSPQAPLASSQQVAEAAAALELLQRRSEESASWELHARVLINRSHVASLQGSKTVAASCLSSAIDLYVSMGYGASVVHLRSQLGNLYSELGDWNSAESCFSEALAMIERSSASSEQPTAGLLPSTNLDILEPFLTFATHLQSTGREDEARQVLQRAFSIANTAEGKGKACVRLAKSLRASNQSKEALQILVEQLELFSAVSTSSDAARYEADVDPFLQMALIRHFDFDDCDDAVKLYEVAAEASLRIVRTVMRNNASDLSIPCVVDAVRNHALILYNASLCYVKAKQYGTSQAIGVMEESIKLLERINENRMTASMRMEFAKLLRHVDVLDQAITQYFAVLEIIDADVKRSSRVPPSAVACEYYSENFQLTSLVHSEVLAHLAHCLHYNVGDFVKAHEYYKAALSLSGNTAVEESMKGMTDAATESQVSVPTAAIRASGQRLRADTLSWILECDADCLRRLQRDEDAILLLNQRLRIGRAVGDHCIPAMFSLIGLLEKAPHRISEAKALYHQLLHLPQDAMTTIERLDLVIRYATFSHYVTHDFSLASLLYSIAMEIEKENPHIIVQYAWCARQLPDHKRPSNSELASLYDHAIAVMEIFKADIAATSDKQEATAHKFARAVFDEVFVLGEAALFFHDVMKDPVKAATLYEKALEVPGSASQSTVHVLSNFAVLKYYVSGDRIAAEQLFQRALQLNSKNFVVSNLYAEYLVNIGDEVAALKHVVSMIDHFPEHCNTIYHKLARLEARLGNMGSPDSREAVLRSFLIAVSGDTSLSVADANDEAIVKLFERSADPGIANDAVVFIHTVLKRLPLANSIYALLLEKFPQNWHLLLNYARAAVEIGSLEKAKELYEQAFLIESSEPTLVEQFADFIASKYPDQVATAEKLHLQCLDLNQNSATAHLSYAIFLTLHLPSASVATKHFKEALRLNPNDANIWAQYGAFAEKQAMLVGTAAPCHADILYEAEKSLKKSCELSSNSATSLMTLGLFYWRSKRFSEAWPELQSAYDKEPNNFQVVSSCAIFVHDRYIVLQNNTTNSGRTPAAFEGDQMQQLAQLSDKLYRKALKMDPTDLHVVKQYARFQREVIKDNAVANEWQDFADKLAMQQLQRSTVKRDDDS